MYDCKHKRLASGSVQPVLPSADSVGAQASPRRYTGICRSCNQIVYFDKKGAA